MYRTGLKLGQNIGTIVKKTLRNTTLQVRNMSQEVVQSGTDGNIEVTFKDGLGIVTLNRGENRLNQDFIDKFNGALDQVLRNKDVKALVTTGVGKFFCNGLDLKWFEYLAQSDPERSYRLMSTEIWRTVIFRIITFPLPTVALVNGHAFAGGAMLAMSHDHVIMQNQRGWLALNEVHLKMRFSPLMFELFRTKLPTGQTHHEATVLGRRFTGDEARAAGIVHVSCPSDEMYSYALNWVKKVVPPNGYNREHLQTMKEDVHKRMLELRNETLTKPNL